MKSATQQAIDPPEAITVEQALVAYTQVRRPRRALAGHLPASDLAATKCVMTIVAGRVAFQAQ
jgi:hypothetical protein